MRSTNLATARLEFGLRLSCRCEARTIWIADAHGDGKRFILHADEKLTAFLELESAIRAVNVELSLLTKLLLTTQFAPQRSQAEQTETEQRNC